MHSRPACARSRPAGSDNCAWTRKNGRTSSYDVSGTGDARASVMQRCLRNVHINEPTERVRRSGTRCGRTEPEPPAVLSPEE